LLWGERKKGVVMCGMV
jgi:hypothetical protein